MACLGDAGKTTSYENFDIENLQQQDQQPGGRSSSSHRRTGGSSRKCPSAAVMLAATALLLSVVALALGISAAVKTRGMGYGGTADDGMFLTTNPRSAPSGWQPVSLFKGTGYFAEQEPMLYPRSDHKSLPIGNTVYLLGGLTNGLELGASEGNTTAAADVANGESVPLVLNATVAYDTYSQKARQLADMPQPRYRHCGAVLNGQLYVVGGMPTFEAADATKHVVTGSVMRYTPGKDTWEVLPGRLNHPRSDCCAAAVAGKLYVAGGYATDYTENLGSVEVFDPSAAAAGWTLMPNLTLPRGDCEAVALDSRTFMVMGGVAPDGNFTSSVETLDVTATNPSWAARANMTKPRGDFAAEALPGGRAIVMGGETGNGTATEFALYDVEEYQQSSDRWVMKAPLPQARFRFDTAHVDDRVYAFGGQPTCSSKADSVKSDCVKVALDTVYGYFDVQYPDVYAVVRGK